MKIITVLIVFFLLATGVAVACQKEEPVLSITPEVTQIPTEEVSPTLEVTIEPSVTIEPTPTAGASATIETHSDGLSDGLSSCPDCTKPHPVLPTNVPSTGKGR